MPHRAKRTLAGLLLGALLSGLSGLPLAFADWEKYWMAVGVTTVGFGALFAVAGDRISARLLVWLDQNSNGLP